MRIVEPRPEQVEIIPPCGLSWRVISWYRARIAAYFAPFDFFPESMHERRCRRRPPPDRRMPRIVDLRL
jgi:hypothetical protein